MKNSFENNKIYLYVISTAYFFRALPLSNVFLEGTPFVPQKIER